MPSTKTRSCAVCGSTTIAPWFRTHFGIMGRCAGCRQVVRLDLPTPEALVELHRSSELHHTAYAEKGEAAGDELPFLTRFLDLLHARAPGGRLLEVGCGTGELTKRAVARGFDLQGIEVIREIREVLQAELPGVPIDGRPLEEIDFPPASFDAVTMVDVIEHLTDPRAGLERVRSLLRPGGLLLVATLRHDCLLYGIYHAMRFTMPPLARRFGPMLYNPFHTYYFTRKSLRRLIENESFRVLEHASYEFPLARLDAGAALKLGMRCIYAVQGVLGLETEQYVLAEMPS